MALLGSWKIKESFIKDNIQMFMWGENVQIISQARWNNLVPLTVHWNEWYILSYSIF